MIRLRTFVLATCALATFAVNAATFTVTNTNDSGAGSLRQAVIDANALAGADRIEFSIGSGSQMIAPLTLLPKITDTVTIDGTTQPGYVNAPLIGLDGSNIAGVQFVTAGFYLEAQDSSVIGLSITNFRVPNVTWSREGAGVIIAETGCSVLKCYLGLQRNGRTAAGNDSGIRIDVGGARIGGQGKGNVISGNYRGIDHIGINPTWASAVENNIIGLSADGRSDVPNVYGMFMTSDLIVNNRIANQYDDIDITGPNSVVAGNKIGIRSDGSLVAMRGASASVVISKGFSTQPTSVRFGGTGAGEGNEVASSSVGVYAIGTSGLQIINNNIHDNYTGIQIDQSPGTKMTGNTIHDNFTGIHIMTSAGNLISANSMYGDYSGIQLDSSANLGIGYPVVTSAKSANGTTTVQGTYAGNGSSAYKLEIFSSPACASDGQGEGKTLLGTVNITTDGSGHATFNTSFSTTVTQGHVVTATATDASNNTSEFSACATVQGAGSFSVAAPGVVEGGNVNVTVTRSNGATGVATVDYATAGGTASAGNDYVAKSGTLTFGDGETQKTFSISTIDDSLYEGSETFVVALSNATGGASITNSSVQVSISDNDAVPTFSVEEISVPKPLSGTAIATFTVRLNRASGVPATINYGTGNDTAIAGADYQAASGTLTFDPGQTSKTIDVTVLSSGATSNREFVLSVYSVANVNPVSRSVRCTILVHNVGVAPASQSIAVGAKGKLTVSFGQPLAADAILNVKSSRPEALSVPATVAVAAGATNATFQVSALTAPASARIEVTLPASIGGDVLLASVSSYEKVTLVLQPSPVSVVAGNSVTVTASLNPASDESQFITLEDSDPSIADAPSSFTIPAGGSGTFNIGGLRPGGTSLRATLPARYGSLTTVLPVDVLDVPTTPTIFTISPATGPASGGTSVTATGARLQTNCMLAFGTTPAQTAFVNDTRLTAITPAHVPGTVEVRLTCGADSFVLPNAFTFLAAGPVLTNVTPSFGNVAGGTIVQLDGSNLSSACGVFFGGSPAHNVALDGSALIATAPQHQAGAVDVTVKCGSEAATRSAAFTYTTSDEPAAAISSVDPLFGSSGQSVTLTGLRFRAGDRVVFGTTPAVILSTTNDTHVVRIPDVPLGKIAITLTDPDDRVTTTGPIFTVVEPIPPKIVSVAPMNVVSGDELVIEGEGFRPGYSFAIGDHAASTLSMSYDRVVVRVPQLDAGSYHVNAINSGGNIAAVGPSITAGAGGVAVMSVSMSCASTDGGGTATIHGSGFTAGASVAFGDAAATDVTVVDAQTITATVPPSTTAGAVRISVTNTNGDSGALSNAFRYASPYDPDGCGARRRSGRY